MKTSAPRRGWLRRLNAALRQNLAPQERSSDYARLGLTRLEDRVVLDGGAGAAVVADINPGVLGASPAELTPFNGSTYFSASGNNASNQPVGRELYRLDSAGVVQFVADINPGDGDSNPAGFTLFQGNLIFAATGPQGRELYKLDTSGNITLFSDVNPGAGGSNPEILISFDNKLFFTAEVNNGRELYIANQGGNSSLTADLNPGSASSNPSELIIFNEKMYFSATNGSARGLYRVNPLGSSSPIPISLGIGVSDPQEFTEFAGKLYFSATSAAEGRELYAMSLVGTSNNNESVARVANLDGTSASSSPGEFYVFQSNLYFAATGVNGRELFRLSSSGTITEFNIAPGSVGSAPSGFTNFNNALHFAATINGQRGLYRLSGMQVVTIALPSGVTLPADVVLTDTSEGLYFAGDGPLGRELYRLESSGAVTFISDLNSGSANSDPEIYRLNSKTYFAATSSNLGRELFVVVATPSSLRVDNGVLIFRDDFGDQDNRISVHTDDFRLHIDDLNAHPIALLTSLPGAVVNFSEIKIPFSSLAGVTSLRIETRGGNDSVTYDFAQGFANLLLSQFSTFYYDGGAQNDKLRFQGEGTLNASYTPSSTTPGAGDVVVSGGGLLSSFHFLNLEPVDFANFVEASLITPITATGADVLTISNGKDSLFGIDDALVVSGTSGGVAIESAYFFENTSVLIQTASGVDGNDTLTVASANNAHGNDHLRINTGTGSDTVTVSGNVNLAATLTIDTHQLAINAAVTTGGSVTLNSLGSTTFSSQGRIATSNDSVTLTAGGAITMADGSSILPGNATIALTAGGDITLGRLVTTNATAAALQISSTAGRILDGGDTGGANLEANSAGAVVTISAAGGVGSSAKPLDIAVRQLLVFTANSDQYLRELDALERIDLQAGTGRIALIAGGTIQDSDVSTDVQAVAFTVQATSVGSSAAPLQIAIGSLTATLTGDLYLVQPTGSLTVAQVTTPSTNAVVSILVSGGDLNLGAINAGGTSSLVLLHAPQGAIRDTNGNLPNLSVASAQLSAAQGIGPGDALETVLANLIASGGTGGVAINNQGNLALGGISAAASNIAITTTGSLNVASPVQTTISGSILLSAGADFIASANADVVADAGAVTLTANRSIALNSGASITTATGAIALLGNQSTPLLTGSFSGITLTGASVASQSGAITLRGKSGATGDGVSLNSSSVQTSNTGEIVVDGTGASAGVRLTSSSVNALGTGDVLLAGSGGVIDIVWDTLTLSKTGGVYTFQDTVQGGSLVIQPGAYQVRFLDGGTITNAVAFQNTGGVQLGNQNSDSITFAGGLTSVASITTLQGTIATQATDMSIGPASLVGQVTLNTSGGHLSAGAIEGGNTPLTINTGSGNATLLDPANIIGDLTITAGTLRLVENDNITQAGAWQIGGLTSLTAMGHDIILPHVANVFGPLQLAGANIQIVEAGSSELTSAQWQGTFSLAGSDDILVTGLVQGSGSLLMQAQDDIQFTSGSIQSSNGADIKLAAGDAIAMADGATILSGTGTIQLTAAGDITLGRLVTTNATSSAVQIISSAGRVLDGGDSGGANIQANNAGAVVTLQAAAGVGTSASPLDVDVRDLVVVTTNTDQYLREHDDLESIHLQAGSGHINLIAGGSIQDSDANLDVQSAAFTVQAFSIGSTAFPLQTAIGTLTATVTTGDLHLTQVTGNLTVTQVTAPATTAVVSILVQAGDLNLGSISAAGNQSLINLSAAQGAIRDANGNAVNLAAHSAQLSATLGISPGDALETSLATLTASGGTGGVLVDNQGSLVLGDVTATQSNIAITSTATLTVSAAVKTTGSGAVGLVAGDDLIATAGANIQSEAGTITLTANRALSLNSVSVSTATGAINLLANEGAIPLSGNFSGIKLTNASVTSVSGTIAVRGTSGTSGDGVHLDSSALETSGSGSITVVGSGAVAGVRLLNHSSINAFGTGNVLLAGEGGAVDIAWDTLTISKTGGIYTFQDTVQGGALLIDPGAYQVQFLDGGFISHAVNFQNTAGVVLGNANTDSITFAGGLTSTASVTALQGAIATQGTRMTFGATTLVSQVSLNTGGGDLSAGAIQGASVSLSINSGSGTVTLANAANVIGNLTITAGTLQLVENDEITQAGAWQIAGTASLNAIGHDIILSEAANVFGPLQLSANNIQIVEAGSSELASAQWSGSFSLVASDDILVTGVVQGSGSLLLQAQDDIQFTSSGAVQATAGGVNVGIVAGDTITMANGASILSGNGTIALASVGNITLGRLLTTNATASAVQITSSAGRVLDGGDAGGANIEANSVGAVVTIQARDGVGTSAKALDIAVRDLVVITINADQYLQEQDSLERIALQAGNGRIILVAGGPIHDNDGLVDVQAAALTVQATSIGTSTAPLQAEIESLTAGATTGDLYLTQVAGSLDVAQVTAPSINAVVSILVQSGNLHLGNVNASGAQSHISLQTPAGVIRDANGSAPNLVASSAQLTAAFGIGPGDALETSLQILTASGGTGGVFIDNQGSLILGLVSTSESSIAISTTGSLNAASPIQTTGSGAIALTAGSDVLLNASINTGNGAIDLHAARDIVASAASILGTQSGIITIAPGRMLSYDGQIEVGAGRVVLIITDSASQLRGSISGSGGMTKRGAGTLTLTDSSINTYLGTTDLFGGTLRVDGVIGAEQAAQRFTLGAFTTLTGGGLVNAPIYSAATSAIIAPVGNLRLGDGSLDGFNFDGQLFVTAGQTVTVRDTNLALLGTLTRITGGGKLVAANGVEVSSGETLMGSGAVAGNVIVRAGGIVSPGASSGVLATEIGDLTLFPNATLIVQVFGTSPGDQYDQINVQGAVSLAGAVLSMQGGLFRANLGQVFTLIVNDGFDPIAGRFQDPSGRLLGEGEIVNFGGISSTLSYFGGPNGNSVTLTVRDRITIVATNTNSANVPLIGGRAQMQEVNFLLARAATVAAPIVTDPPPPPSANAPIDARTAALELRQADRTRVYFRVVNGATGTDEPKEFELDPQVLRDLLGFFKRFKFQDGHYRIYLQEPGKKERLILDVHIVDGRIVPPDFRETEGSGTAKPPMDSPAPMKDEAPKADINDADARSIDPAALRAALIQEHVSLTKVGRLLRKAR